MPDEVSAATRLPRAVGRDHQADGHRVTREDRADIDRVGGVDTSGGARDRERAVLVGVQPRRRGGDTRDRTRRHRSRDRQRHGADHDAELLRDPVLLRVRGLGDLVELRLVRCVDLQVRGEGNEAVQVATRAHLPASGQMPSCVVRRHAVVVDRHRAGILQRDEDTHGQRVAGVDLAEPNNLGHAIDHDDRVRRGGSHRLEVLAERAVREVDLGVRQREIRGRGCRRRLIHGRGRGQDHREGHPALDHQLVGARLREREEQRGGIAQLLRRERTLDADLGACVVDPSASHYARVRELLRDAQEAPVGGRDQPIRVRLAHALHYANDGLLHRGVRRGEDDAVTRLDARGHEVRRRDTRDRDQGAVRVDRRHARAENGCDR